MTTDLTTAAHPITPEVAARMTASWLDLVHSPVVTETEAVSILTAAKQLRTPATRDWIAGRTATLLSQYFVSSVPEQMMREIAADWHDALRTYPAWAIQNACRWWLGEGNADRKRRPLPGDIAARARHELGVVRLAEGAAKRSLPPVETAPDQFQPVKINVRRFGK